MNDLCITSKRLYIITPKIEILKRRLGEENFHELVYINNRHEKILFPSDWPGNALSIYPMEIERREKNTNLLPY